MAKTVSEKTLWRKYQRALARRLHAQAAVIEALAMTGPRAALARKVAREAVRREGAAAEKALAAWQKVATRKEAK